MAIGCETVSILENTRPYDSLEQKAARLEQGFRENLKKLGLDYTINRVGSMFCLFFTGHKVDSYASCMTSDSKLFQAFFREMLAGGIYIAPSPFEVSFLSLAHTDAGRERSYPLDHVVRQRIENEAGAGLAGQIQAIRTDVGSDNIAGPHDLRHEYDEQPDRTGTHYGHRVPHHTHEPGAGCLFFTGQL